ncbi:MAG: helix-turn-helix transcriptional regulator [Nitrospinae bacterium]|nr:helix-turn-helix transcriptional regulator [Nitrospinota bacterium]
MECIGPTISKEEIKKLNKILTFSPEIEELSVFFGLWKNPARLKIFYLLSIEKKLCVCDISEVLGITISAVSQHLSKMKAYNIVKYKRENQTIYYYLTDHPLNLKIKEHFIDSLNI